MVQKENPDYVLTIKHVTEYYDMKMVTFGVNDGEELLVAFPVFVQDHTRESMTLQDKLRNVIVSGSEELWEGLFSTLIFPEMQSPLTAISSQPEDTHQSI